GELGAQTLKCQGFLALVQVPQPGRPVLGHTGETPAVRAERHRALSLEAVELLTRRYVPNLHGAVTRGAGQVLAVRAKGHAEDRAGVPLERQDFLSLRQAPDLDLDLLDALRLLILDETAGGQALAVRANDRTGKARRLHLERDTLLACRHVPYLQLPTGGEP